MLLPMTPILFLLLALACVGHCYRRRIKPLKAHSSVHPDPIDESIIALGTGAALVQQLHLDSASRDYEIGNAAPRVWKDMALILLNSASNPALAFQFDCLTTARGSGSRALSACRRSAPPTMVQNPGLTPQYPGAPWMPTALPKEAYFPKRGKKMVKQYRHQLKRKKDFPPDWKDSEAKRQRSLNEFLDKVEAGEANKRDLDDPEMHKYWKSLYPPGEFTEEVLTAEKYFQHLKNSAAGQFDYSHWIHDNMHKKRLPWWDREWGHWKLHKEYNVMRGKVADEYDQIKELKPEKLSEMIQEDTLFQNFYTEPYEFKHPKIGPPSKYPWFYSIDDEQLIDFYDDPLRNRLNVEEKNLFWDRSYMLDPYEMHMLDKKRKPTEVKEEPMEYEPGMIVCRASDNNTSDSDPKPLYTVLQKDMSGDKVEQYLIEDEDGKEFTLKPEEVEFPAEEPSYFEIMSENLTGIVAQTSPQKAFIMVSGREGTIIDLRDPYSHGESSPPGSVSLPAGGIGLSSGAVFSFRDDFKEGLVDKIRSSDYTRPLLLLCSMGMVSKITAEILAKEDADIDVRVISGGYEAWQADASLPCHEPDGPPLEEKDIDSFTGLLEKQSFGGENAAAIFTKWEKYIPEKKKKRKGWVDEDEDLLYAELEINEWDDENTRLDKQRRLMAHEQAKRDREDKDKMLKDLGLGFIETDEDEDWENDDYVDSGKFKGWAALPSKWDIELEEAQERLRVRRGEKKIEGEDEEDEEDEDEDDGPIDYMAEFDTTEVDKARAAAGDMDEDDWDDIIAGVDDDEEDEYDIPELVVPDQLKYDTGDIKFLLEADEMKLKKLDGSGEGQVLEKRIAEGYVPDDGYVMDTSNIVLDGKPSVSGAESALSGEQPSAPVARKSRSETEKPPAWLVDVSQMQFSGLTDRADISKFKVPELKSWLWEETGEKAAGKKAQLVERVFEVWRKKIGLEDFDLNL